jgi:fibronectin type 3 domain-containing protein
MKKKCISLLVCTALIFTMLFALPMTTAQAADVTLEVTHAISGNLSLEISAALGGDVSAYTKILINIGSVDLSGNSESGDWSTLYGLNALLPNVASLELVYNTSGTHVLPDYAMYVSGHSGASWLKTLQLTTNGSQLTSIGAHAFHNCTALKTLSLPNNIIGIDDTPSLSIGEYAFLQTGLSGTLTIPFSVYNIGSNAFGLCYKLTALDLPENDNLSIGEGAFQQCEGLSGTLTIPSSVTRISRGAFYRCGISALTIPASVTDIETNAFASCTGLTALDLPETGSLSIGEGAFANCMGLRGTVVIPSSVTSIGINAFNNCIKMNALVFKKSAAPTMSSAITDQAQIVAYYPEAAQTSYDAQSGFPANRFAYSDDTPLITSFYIGSISGSVDQTAKTVTLELPDGTILSSLQPEVAIIGSGVSPASGAAQDFSSRKRIYTVTPVSGTPAAYTVRIVGYPAVSGSNALSGTVGKVGDQTAVATVSKSYPAKITPTASISGQEDMASRIGNGSVAFTFSSSLFEDLAVGRYPITVSMDATALNKAIASTQIGTLTVKPLAPTMKTATAATGSVTVNWNAVTGANGYKVYSYNSTTKAYTEIASTAGTSYTQTGRAANTTYSYAVRAYQTVGGTPIYSDYSLVASAKTPLPVIGIPSALKAVSASYNSIKLTWTAASGATNYVVYRATAKSGPYTQLTSAPTSSGYTNTGLKSGTTYYYKIKAYVKINGTTVYGKETAVVSAKPIPSAPGAMKAVKASSTSIKLTWGAVSGATKYEVYRATASGGKYTLVNTTTGKSFTNKKLAKGKTYYYKVCAIRMEGKTKVTGAYSVIVNVKL